MRVLIAGLLLLLALPAAAQVSYYRIEANERGVGFARSERQAHADRLIRIEQMRLRISRDQQVLDIRVEERREESLLGAPLKFSSRTQFSGYESFNSGRQINPTTLEVTQTSPGFSETRRIAIGAEVLFPEAIERRLLETGFVTGAELEVRTLLPDTLQPATQRFRVLGPVTQNGQSAFRVSSKVLINDAQVLEDSELIYSAKGELLEQSLQLLGARLTLRLTNKANAQAALAEGAWNILDTAVIASPLALPESERDWPRKIVLASATAGFNPALSSAEQRVRMLTPRTLEFTVGALPLKREAAPQRRHLQANAWIQSDDPRLRALAEKAVRDVDADPLARMQALERFVAVYIERKDLSQGYASALEAARTRRGDCTEHALLLAALGRALGIPTRIAAGLAYAQSFAGRETVFVPHAWTQAYVAGAWRSFDAALGRFDTRRVGLSFGNGEPWDFAGALNARGAVEIKQITTTKVTALESR